MPPAIIAAGVGAAASIGGAVLSSSAQKKAANKAAGVAQDNTAANNALAREIYGKNSALLSPYNERGNAAGNALNAMLGLGTQQSGGPSVAGLPTPGAYGTPGIGDQVLRDRGMFGVEGIRLPEYFPSMRLVNESPFLSAAPGQPNGPAPAQQTSPGDPFKQYIANSDYAFNMGEGANALNKGYAASGTLESGAAMKALEKYRQNLQAGYRNEYMGYLGNQQGVGLSGASAVAGVGQNYANNVTANNNSGASAAANAALFKGAANSNMYGTIGNALGNVFGSSYRP